MDLSRLFPLLFFNLIYLIKPNNGDLPYEPINNICERCICIGNDVENKANHHYVLDCTAKGLQHFLTGWPESFGTNHTGKDIVVSFSNNEINTLQQLSETMARVYFSCRHCKIKDLKSAAFVDVPNILRLDLSYNDITSDELRPDVFRGRYNDEFYESILLNDLDLSHNYIKILDELLFEHLPNLKRLSLAYNEIEFTINNNNNNNNDNDPTAQSIGTNKKMEHLDLSYNNINAIPDVVFKNMNKLRELLLHGNRLLQVPESLSLLGNTLKSLYIGNNHIEILNDESFTGLKQLTHLNISNNKNLYEINDNTFVHLLSLEVLTCCNNSKLKKIDLNSLLNLKNMRELDLSNCSFKELYLDDVTDIDKNNIDRNNQNHTINDNDNKKQLIKLRSIKLKNNPWHCDCMFTNILEELKHYNANEFQSDDEARCNTPYDLAGTLLTDLKSLMLCNLSDTKRPLRVPSYDPPPFLRPRSIVLTILTVLAVVIIGLIVGFIIVFIKKKLRKVDIGFSAPVRYTTVRNSTISVQ